MEKDLRIWCNLFKRLKIYIFNFGAEYFTLIIGITSLNLNEIGISYRILTLYQ